MKTKDKIKRLCRDKYNMSLTEYERKLGFGNGLLSKNGHLRSDRLFIVARDLGVEMESLMDDEMIDYTVTTSAENKVFSSVEVEIIDAYRNASPDMKSFVMLALKLRKPTED